MVARSSRDTWSEAAGVAAQALVLCDRLSELVDADAAVWEQALTALEESGAGDTVLERRLEEAAAVPLAIAEAAADAAALAELAATRGDGAFRADAAVAVVLAAAGAHAACHLVEVNLGVREGDERLRRARRSNDEAAEAVRRTLDAAR